MRDIQKERETDRVGDRKRERETIPNSISIYIPILSVFVLAFKLIIFAIL